MRKTAGWFAAAAALMMIAGCVSGERAFRNSPAGGETGIRFDGNSVNLWPFYYRSDDLTSVLWPVFDMDRRGFAVRPFYYQDGDDASVLWPLSGWNRSGGWALNCFWGRNHFAALPFFVRSDFLHIAGPVYWFDGRGDVGGLFPVAYWNLPAGRWYAGPVWRGRKKGGLFPVAWFSSSFNMAGPVWWYGDGSSYGLFPVYWNGSAFHLAGPAWWFSGGEAWGFFPLVWITGDYRIAGPVWWRKHYPEGGLFPLAGWYPNGIRHWGPVWWRKRESVQSHGFFPLYFYDSYSDGFKFNAGLPLLTAERRRSENRSFDRWDFLWPLVAWRRSNTVLDWRVWPLVNYSESGIWSGLPSPVLQFKANRNPHTDPLPEVRDMPSGNSFPDDRRRPNYVRETCKTYIGTFLAYHETGTARVWKEGENREALEALARQSRLLSSALSRKSGLEESADAPEKEKVRTEVTALRGELSELLSKLDPAIPVPETPEEVSALRRLLAERFCTDVNFYEHRTLCGLTSWYEQFGSDYWGQFGLGAVYMYRYGNRSDFRLLGFLCRIKHDGDQSEYLYPPFISVKKAPGRYRWSLLHRVFSYENNDGRKSGHVFFIPWGDR